MLLLLLLPLPLLPLLLLLLLLLGTLLVLVPADGAAGCGQPWCVTLFAAPAAPPAHLLAAELLTY